MIALIGCFAGLFLYLEIVYHFSGFGFVGCMPVYVLMQIITWSGLWALLIGILKGIWKKIVFYAVIWISIVWAGAQTVYLHIFKQPLLWEGIFRGGQDALTNYWREALEGILQVLPFLLLLILPGIAIGLFLKIKKRKLPQFQMLQVLRTLLVVCIGLVGQVVTMEIGKAAEADYYESYTDFYDPLSVAENMGFLPMLQRDTHLSLLQGFDGLWEKLTAGSLDEQEETQALEGSEASEASSDSDAAEQNSGEGTETDAGAGAENGAETQTLASEEIPEEPEEPAFHELAIDFDKLRGLADNDKKQWLADYIQGQACTASNEYTGQFAGYNLIYLTAEGFSPYAVREDLTPTLYRLVNTGFVFENFYAPLWQTSTSDGEYINCTGMIPDGQFSMRKSGSNEMPYTLAKFFAKEGVSPLAYHNNSLSYYDRYVTHPNMGYDFKGCRLGSLGEEWSSKVFLMENPDAWPSSDLDMMQGTLPEYIGSERFHVYYMTISGHMNYNFSGNAMSAKNKEAVAGLEMSENARAYIACNIELDKALEYLLQQLEAAGKLENTVICMSADHYPYGMTTEQYEELAGKALSQGMDLYRNNLVLWNSQMEAEPVYVKKVCGPMDIVPTLLNLFGFTYDSRMYAGRDILAEDVEGLVIFNDRSFVTDSVIYNKKGKQTIWITDENGNPKVPAEKQEAYLDAVKQEVKDRYQFSGYVLQTNYYKDVLEATQETAQEQAQPQETVGLQ